MLATAILGATSACAQLPAGEAMAGDSELQQRLAAAERAPLPAELEGVAATPSQQRFVVRVNALEQALTGQPLVPGNKVELLANGPLTHREQLAEIAKAKHHVHLCVYIFTDDAVGHRYLDAFRDLVKRGVKVRVMFDAMGARGAGEEFRKQMEAAGVELVEFGPVNPVKNPKDFETSHRNHRKILVVDGRVAFTGGINISDEYKVNPGASQSSAGWRDTNVRIEGPAVAQFQKLFLDSWEAERGPVPPAPDYYPKLPRAGHVLVRAVNHDGKDLSEVFLAPITGLTQDEREKGADNEIYASYLAAITEARSRVWITQAYFIPNKSFLEMLKQAARRGVDVRLLVPGYTDIPTMLAASRYHYDQLLQNGIHVFEYTKSEAVLHAKTAVIDSVWATVGSSNLDYRSFIHNDEANAVIIGHDFAQQMEDMFQHDLETAREIKLDEWRERPWREKLREHWAVLFKYWI